MVGPAIPALVLLIIPLVSALSSSMSVGGFLEAIWRWSLKPTFQLLLDTVLSLLGIATLPLSFVKLVILRFGHPLVRTSLLVAMWGVGVISLHGATLSLPTLFDSSFKEFFRIGRAMRVVLPLGNGGVVHLFVIYGYQGAEGDPEKLQLSEHLFAAVLAEAGMCCDGQPVILAGDFNAEPTVIPSLARSVSDGHWVDLEQAFATGRGVPPSSTCQFQLDEDKGSRRDFLLACPIALAAATACSVFPDRWFTPHFAVCAEFSLSAWDATVERARIHSPLWPACWLNCPDRSRSSQSHEVRDIWDVYIREVGFVPLEVRSHLFRLCNSPDVDSSWLLWSREAEASLARAYLSAGGPPLSNPGSYVGRGYLSICTMRLVLSPRSILGLIGFLLTFMDFISGLWTL